MKFFVFFIAMTIMGLGTAIKADAQDTSIALWNGARVNDLLAQRIQIDADTAALQFISKPAITVSFEDPFSERISKPVRKYALKTLLERGERINVNTPNSAVSIEMTRNIMTYNRKEFLDDYREGESAEDFIKGLWWEKENEDYRDSIYSRAVTVQALCSGIDSEGIRLPKATEMNYQFRFCAPIIDSAPGMITVKTVDFISGRVSYDSAIVMTNAMTCQLYGRYFGKKPPKVWIEYKLLDKPADQKMQKLNLKVTKIAKAYAYPDAQGNLGKSCTDPLTGNSQITVKTPHGWPKKFPEVEGGENVFILVIDNGSGIATHKVKIERL